MPDQLFNNIVIFRAYDGPAVLLRPDGDWTWESGIKPSVFSAVCAYSEFDKLGGDYDRYGQLEFYFEGRPENGMGAADLVLQDWRLVDIQAGNYQMIEGVGVRTLEYQLAFADAREGFVGARGGVLSDGEINTEPLSKDGNRDFNENPVLTTRALVQKCIDAMGILCSVPRDLSDAPFVLNIDWRGNSAPDELEKLLTDSGYVFVVKNDGFAIEKRGTGKLPDQPQGRVILDAAYPGIDRRGGSVIFSSAPLAVVNTADYTMDDFEWVMLDTADEKTGRENWVELSKSALLKGLDPIDVIKKDYEPVPEKNRRRVQNFLYCALRLKQDVAGPGPMMRYNYDTATALTQISVLANTIKYHLPTGAAVMYDDLTEIPPTQLMGSGTVLVLPEPLGKLAGGKSEGDFATDFTPLETDDLKIRLTREVYEPNNDGTWKGPLFYRVGFKQELGRIVRMSDKEMNAALADGKTGFYSMPQLRLYQVDGQDQNRTQLEGIGFGLAEKYVGGSGNGPRIVACAGYVPAELSGKVNSITWSFGPPKTSWKSNTWYMPHEVSPVMVKPADKKNGGKFPKAAETADRRTAEGIAGGQQPSVVLNPKTFTQRASDGIVKITAKGDHGGWYTGIIQKGSATIDPTVNFQPNSNGAITGMSDGAAVNVLNLLEGAGGHALAIPCYAEYEVIGPGDDNRITVAVRVTPAGSMVYVNLTNDGTGTDGNETTAPSYLYTVKLITGEQVLTGASPQCGRAVGSFTPALHGWGFFTPEGNFILTNAHEVEAAEPCPT